MTTMQPSPVETGPTPSAGRKRFNTILPGRLYQRGQITSWPREDKVKTFAELNIGVVVNFWPKLDANYDGSFVDWYYYCPVPDSADMLKPAVLIAAEAVAKYIQLTGRAALVLCEAGKTRSVFFCVLVCRMLNLWTAEQAGNLVTECVPHHAMKPYMMDYIKQGRG